MAHDITWYIPDQVVYIIFYGDVTVSDLHSINSFMMRHLERSSRPIHVIMDAAKVARVQTTPSEMAAHLPYLSHPHLGWNVTLHTNGFTRFLASMVFQMTRTRACFSNSIEEAISFLTDIDETIQWEQAAVVLEGGF